MDGTTVGLSAMEIAQAVKRRAVSASEVIRDHLEHIETADGPIGAFCEVLGDAAQSEAKRLDGNHWDTRAKPLLGVPLAVKDNIETEEGHTRHGSKAFRNHRAGFDAVIVGRLRQAGCIVIGKTSTPEFALRATTESDLYGATRNPWDLRRTPGGSSGGSAAAVAARMAPVAIGNDGGGSIRMPASCCGVIGVKPSRGRVTWAPGSREYWAGLATNGPLTFSVLDAAWTCDVMGTPDPGDPYGAIATRGSARDGVEEGVNRPLRIGVATDGPLGEVGAIIAEVVETAAERLSAMGHSVVKDSPSLDGLLDVFTTIGAANFAASAYEPQQDALVEEYSRRLRDEGSRLSAITYIRAVAEARSRAAEIVGFWKNFDILLTPAMSVETPLVQTQYDDPSRWHDYLYWVQFLFPFNITGQPAIVVPSGASQEGLPIGVQLVGAPGRDDIVFALAAAYELVCPALRPPTTRI
jgi:amidase